MRTVTLTAAVSAILAAALGGTPRRRTMPSFSLKWMLAGVTAVALGCVVLLNAGRVSFATTLGVALLLLLSAPVGIVYRTGSRRAFWIGFAVFGWCYFLALLSGASTSLTAFRALPTNELEIHLYNLAPKQAVQREVPPGVVAPATIMVPSERYFRRVFHSLVIILLAFVGGVIGRCFYATMDGKRADRPNTS